MIQFNIHRFGKLVKWSLTNDRKYYIKSFLQVLVALLLVFLFFTSITITMRGQSGNYTACCAVVMVMFVVTVIIGPSFMFYSMEGKHDMQTLLMLPASNFEKYLMRYSSWIILLPLYLVAFFAADLLQYLFNVLVGHDYATFVTTALVDHVGDTWAKIPMEDYHGIVSYLILIPVWFHSLYALGATFFRSRKFNWVQTTIVIILIIALDEWLIPDSDKDANVINSPGVIELSFYIVWVVLNFWLSYKFFSRTQVKAKFVNI